MSLNFASNYLVTEENFPCIPSFLSLMLCGILLETFPVDKSPVKCFMEEMYAGNSLRSTVALGNEKERERVYDTIFRLPWRCELV